MSLNVNCYRPQGKVLFSEACVSHSVHGSREGGGMMSLCVFGPMVRVGGRGWSVPWYIRGGDCGPSLGEGFGPSSPGARHPWKEQGTRQEVTSYTHPLPVLPSSCGHCSGRFASHWNAFFLFTDRVVCFRHRSSTYAKAGSTTPSNPPTHHNRRKDTSCFVALFGIIFVRYGN